MFFFVIYIICLLPLFAISQRVKVVNFGAFPTEHITIHINENIRTSTTDNPQKLDSQTKKELEDITAIFTMFSLLDELSNALFQGANHGNRGFLSPDNDSSGDAGGKRPSKARQSVFDKIIEEVIKEEEGEEVRDKNADFKEAHVEFKEGKTTMGEENQQKLIENIKKKEESENTSASKESADFENAEQTDSPEKSANIGNNEEEKKLENDTVISIKKKEEKNEKNDRSGGRSGNVIVILAAVVVALVLYGILKCKMVKFDNSADETNKVHQKKAAQD